MKRSERYALNEMAAKDLEGIDLAKGSDFIAKQYVDNYKKRSGKEFSPQALASMKKALADRDDVDAIVAAARKYGNVKTAKSHEERSKESNTKKAEANAESNEIMSKNVGALAKKASEVQVESMMDIIRKNSGLMMITESSKEELLSLKKIRIFCQKIARDGIPKWNEDAIQMSDDIRQIIRDSNDIIKVKSFCKKIIKEGEPQWNEEAIQVVGDVLEMIKDSNKQPTGGLNNESVNESKGSKTAKCPTCGSKYLVKTGYCLSCKKKVGSKVKKEEASDEGDQEPKNSCSTDDKKKKKK